VLLDLFCGENHSVSQAAAKFGIALDVITVDMRESCNPTIVAEVAAWGTSY
jgi:hypothetical protein